ncbi:MAG: ribonuclease J [Chloroflexota bacterium]|nr:ribonuclease J [Chloroflexota bacterium]
MPKSKVRIIPLGGLGEIGKNMMAVECGEDILVIDAGLMFPEEEMPGVDLVIPDISYLVENRDRVRALVVTHGHEDHTGALPYVLPKLDVPIYATKLTQGLIAVKLKEHHLLDKVKLNTVQAGDEVNIGCFRLEFFHVCHSIPDGVGIALHTPVGLIIHTGDFKFDQTPVDGRLTDFSRLARLGGQDVLALLSDSTNSERPGYTPSERQVGEMFDRVFMRAPGRIIIATFASNISRIQQVIEAAIRYDRRVAVIGRSMTENVRMSVELGYLDVPEGVLMRVDEAGRLPRDKVAIITTGSQGEPTSALTRMANREHRQLQIEDGDTVVISATPIPGNEESVNHTIDNLFRQGADVVYDTLTNVHVSGHGAQEDQKMMLNLLRPRFFMPIHGEYRHLRLHAKTAEELGMAPANIFILENGQVLEFGLHSAKINGKVPAGYVLVDGLGVGDVGHVVLRDRKLLSEDGVVIVNVTVDKQTGRPVSEPDIISRGFIYEPDSEGLLEMAREKVNAALAEGVTRSAERGYISAKIKETLGRFLYDQTHRRPMILPVVTEV